MRNSEKPRADIWVSGTGQSIASYNNNAKVVALFDQIVANIQKALQIAEYPKMNDYFMASIEGNTHFIILYEGNLQWGMAVDGNKTQLGLLLNIAIPNAREALKEAL